MAATLRETRQIPPAFGTRLGRQSPLRAGDWVEVRPLDEVMATLDGEGRLDAMPFMAEMARCCGQRFQVYKSAHKTCDTITSFTGRRLDDTVHLVGARCDGSFHGGCQAGCLMFWKEAWLRPLRAAQEGADEALDDAADDAGVATLAQQAFVDATGNGETRYRCQATELLSATAPLRFYDPRPYLQDLATRNLTWWALLRAAVRWLGERQQIMTRIRGAPRPGGARESADACAGLAPGELVQVRPMAEILATLDDKAQNRGLSFDTEMAPYCGRFFRVLRRIDRILDERTGRMLQLKKDCIVLDGVTCSGLHCGIKRLGCPRAVYPYWREAWLRRIDGAEAAAVPVVAQQAAAMPEAPQEAAE